MPTSDAPLMEHLRDVCDSELDGSPNKGAKKKICKLATIVEECVHKGSRAANMGYAVDARYKTKFGNTSLEDLDELASPSGGAASACATIENCHALEAEIYTDSSGVAAGAGADGAHAHARDALDRIG